MASASYCPNFEVLESATQLALLQTVGKRSVQAASLVIPTTLVLFCFEGSHVALNDNFCKPGAVLNDCTNTAPLTKCSGMQCWACPA